MCEEKKLYRAFILSRSADSEHKIQNLQKQTNIYTEVNRKHLLQHFAGATENKIVKGTWKILNKVINKKYNKPTYPEYFLTNNTQISKKEDIANGFNLLFFLQILVQIWQKISHYLIKMFRFRITWKEK